MHDASLHLSVGNVFAICIGFSPWGMGVSLSLTNLNPIFLTKQGGIHRYEESWSIVEGLGGWRLKVKRVKIEDAEHWVWLNSVLCSKGAWVTTGCCPVVLCSEMWQGEGRETDPMLVSILPSLLSSFPLLLWMARTRRGFMRRFHDCDFVG